MLDKIAFGLRDLAQGLFEVAGIVQGCNTSRLG
jgi:hypothetical protein